MFRIGENFLGQLTGCSLRFGLEVCLQINTIMSLSLPAPRPLLIQNSFIGSVTRKCKLKLTYKLLRFFLRSMTLDFGVRHPHLSKICVLYHHPCLAKMSLSQFSAHKWTSYALKFFWGILLSSGEHIAFVIKVKMPHFLSSVSMGTKKTKWFSQLLVMDNDTMNCKSFMCVPVLVGTLVSAPGLHPESVCSHPIARW